MIAEMERLQALEEENSRAMENLSREVRILKRQMEMLADKLAGATKCGKIMSAAD